MCIGFAYSRCFVNSSVRRGEAIVEFSVFFFVEKFSG